MSGTVDKNGRDYSTANITFSSNLVTDTNATYTMYFSNQTMRDEKKSKLWNSVHRGFYQNDIPEGGIMVNHTWT